MTGPRWRHELAQKRLNVRNRTMNTCADMRVADIISDTPEARAKKAELLRAVSKAKRAQHKAMTRPRTPEEIERMQTKRRLARERKAALPDFKDGE